MDWNDVLQSEEIEKASNIMMARVRDTKNECCIKVSHLHKKYNLPELNLNLDYHMKCGNLK